VVPVVRELAVTVDPIGEAVASRTVSKTEQTRRLARGWKKATPSAALR
jgi:hypothetical protein